MEHYGENNIIIVNYTFLLIIVTFFKNLSR